MFFKNRLILLVYRYKDQLRSDKDLESFVPRRSLFDSFGSWFDFLSIGTKISLRSDKDFGSGFRDRHRGSLSMSVVVLSRVSLPQMSSRQVILVFLSEFVVLSRVSPP